MGIIAAGATDIGRVRKTNQDSICLLNDVHFYAVADGMGGHQGGDIASQLSVKLMPDFIHRHPDMDPKTLVNDCIVFINKSILAHAQKNPELEGMGTTITSIYFFGGQLFAGNVGDSRVYLIQKNSIFQLTRDHSFVQEKINMGVSTREEAALDKQKNVLVRSVGFEEILIVDVFSYRVAKNDLFLLCSDGLHGKVSDKDILQLVNTHIPHPEKATKTDIEKAVSELIQLANANGGQDNISVIIALAQANEE
jgi:serine/threonine protein phosphatase PrpC